MKKYLIIAAYKVELMKSPPVIALSAAQEHIVVDSSVHSSPILHISRQYYQYYYFTVLLLQVIHR